MSAKMSPPNEPKTFVPNACAWERRVSKVVVGGKERETYDGDGVGLTDYGAGKHEVVCGVCEKVGDDNDRHGRVDDAREVSRWVFHFSSNKVDLRSSIKMRRPKE